MVSLSTSSTCCDADTWQSSSAKVLYLSMLYKRDEMALRMGLVYSSASLSGAFGGLLATGLNRMDGVGGYAGWRFVFFLPSVVGRPNVVPRRSWLFIMEGLMVHKPPPLTVRAVAEVFFRPSSSASGPTSSSAPLSRPPRFSLLKNGFTPTHASMPTSRRAPPGSAMPTSSAGTKFVVRCSTSRPGSRRRRTLRSFRRYTPSDSSCPLCASLHSPSQDSALTSCRPNSIRGLGYTAIEAQLYSVPPYAVAAALTIVVAIFSDRQKSRGPWMLLCLPFSIAGYAMIRTSSSNNVKYGASSFSLAETY